jgi:hypothetical protein
MYETVVKSWESKGGEPLRDYADQLRDDIESLLGDFFQKIV